MTIISASCKTDIPAFFGDWFRARRMAGSCEVRNPWNGKTFRVSLRHEEYSGFVFWTRNAQPFAAELARTAETHPFMVQYTVTGHPRALERAVVAADTAIDDIRATSGLCGPRAIVWRHDPMVITDAKPAGWHIKNFTRLADGLAGHVDEVVTSFAQIYRKTRRNLNRAADATGNAWSDPDIAEKNDLLAALTEIATARGLALTLCTQPYIAASAARCIDAESVDDMAAQLGHARVLARTKGSPPGCLCAESRDIENHETCSHGCVYCYAVVNHDRARQVLKFHNPGPPMLAGTEMISA